MTEDDFSPNYKLHTGDHSNIQIHVYMWARVCTCVHTHRVWKWYTIQRMDTCICFYRYIPHILMQSIFQSLINIFYLHTSHLLTHEHTIQYYRNVYTTLQQKSPCMYHVAISLALVQVKQVYRTIPRTGGAKPDLLLA